MNLTDEKTETLAHVTIDLTKLTRDDRIDIVEWLTANNYNADCITGLYGEMLQAQYLWTLLRTFDFVLADKAVEFKLRFGGR